MTSKTQLQYWAYGFGRNTTVGTVKALGVKQLHDQEGFARGLPFVAWAFYTGFAGNWCNWNVKSCRSCGVVYAEKPLDRCRIPGFHKPDNDNVRYNREKFGPRRYTVGDDGIRTQETEDKINASKAKAAAKEKEKHKGVGVLQPDRGSIRGSNL